MASLSLVRQRLKEYAAVTSQADANRLMRQILDGIARDNRHLILLGRGPDTSSIETLPPVYYMEVIRALHKGAKEARLNNRQRRLAELTSTAHTDRAIKNAGPARVGKALANQHCGAPEGSGGRASPESGSRHGGEAPARDCPIAS
jgi:hypothetical protein